MSVLTKSVRDGLVAYDSTYTHRWYEAVGDNVFKFLTHFVRLPVDDTTGDPVEFVNTVTEVGAGNSTAVLTDEGMGALLITTAGNENDGYQMQLGGAGGGECVSFAARYPTYFGIRFKINDVDQTDCLFGLCVTDTDCLGAVTDGMYFRSVDESAALYFVAEQNSVESASAVATLADDTWVIAEFLYDTDGTVDVYVNGSLAVSLADSDENFPNDELLRLTMEFLTGEAVANTCTIDWVRLIQIRA